jgi:hypothetical protein
MVSLLFVTWKQGAQGQSKTVVIQDFRGKLKQKEGIESLVDTCHDRERL